MQKQGTFTKYVFNRENDPITQEPLNQTIQG